MNAPVPIWTPERAKALGAEAIALCERIGDAGRWIELAHTFDAADVAKDVGGMRIALGRLRELAGKVGAEREAERVAAQKSAGAYCGTCSATVFDAQIAGPTCPMIACPHRPRGTPSPIVGKVGR